MSGRPKIFNEEEVIDKAIEVFWKNGYESSSTDVLLEAMGIGKSSFYLAFKGGKKELFERALAQRSAKALGRLEKEFQESDDKLATLKDMFFSVLDGKNKRSSNGCFFGNTVAELSNVDVSLKQKAAEMLLLLEKLFLKTIKECQKNGDINSKEDPEVLAKYLLTIWNGLNISVRIYPNKKLLKPMIVKQLEILQ